MKKVYQFLDKKLFTIVCVPDIGRGHLQTKDRRTSKRAKRVSRTTKEETPEILVRSFKSEDGRSASIVLEIIIRNSNHKLEEHFKDYCAMW